MFWRMAKSVLILPGTALVYVPLVIQWLSGGWPFGASVGTLSQFVLAAMLAMPALALATKTMRLFVHEGEGTPAPWDPPLNFVVTGPYRYMRNPMLSAVIMMILAEALALNSLPLLGWAFVFLLCISCSSKNLGWSGALAIPTCAKRKKFRDGFQECAPMNLPVTSGVNPP